MTYVCWLSIVAATGGVGGVGGCGDDDPAETTPTTSSTTTSGSTTTTTGGGEGGRGDGGSGGDSSGGAGGSGGRGEGGMGGGSGGESGSVGGSDGAGGSGGSGGGSDLVNDCDPDGLDTEDLTGQPNVSVLIVGSDYDPPCFRVTAGTEVSFEASLTHPVVGGTVEAGIATPDASSPIVSTSSNATYTLGTAGAYGFYCEVHYGSGLKGAVFVVP